MASFDENYWKSLVIEWSQSGIGPLAFCRSKGISSSTFFYWRKKYADVSKSFSKTKKAEVKVGFVEIGRQFEEEDKKPLSSSSSVKFLLIKTSYGCTIEVPL